MTSVGIAVAMFSILAVILAPRLFNMEMLPGHYMVRSANNWKLPRLASCKLWVTMVRAVILTILPPILVALLGSLLQSALM